MQGTFRAFAAIRSDGSVTTWGEASFGGDSQMVSERLKDVIQIEATGGAFAALTEDGDVVTWGMELAGGDTAAFRHELRGISKLSACSLAFAALREEGTVVTWGHAQFGGDSRAVQDSLTDVRDLVSTGGAFAALLADGSVVAWGFAECGGDISEMREQLQGVRQLASEQPCNFVATLSNGGTVRWGADSVPVALYFAVRSLSVTAGGGELPAGAISAPGPQLEILIIFEVPLFVTNAARTPSASAEGGVGNTWVLESFVDLQNTSAVLAAAWPKKVPGYEIRDLLEATIGGNTMAMNEAADAPPSREAVVTTIFVWFVASQFLDIGSAVELHAPPGYELRCNPRVQYISLPAGSCSLISGVTSTTGDVFHQYLSLALTLPGQQVYPNTAYEFGVAAVNPSAAATPNFWGLVLRKPGGEVADSIRTLPGYDLTDFQLDVQTPLPSSTRPAVVSFVRVALTFARELAPGQVAHISIVAPASTKVLCQRLRDLSGGGNSAEALPLDPSIGTYGTHTCQLQNSVTMHLLLSRPILAASYLIELGVLNPGIRAAKDFWTLELIEEVMEWRTAPAVLQIQVPGFGVSNPFAGVDIAAIASNAAMKAAAVSLVALRHLLVP
ncbi:unnamed protein product [Symbiodinium sp. KB8]|nr:unnamed protein product [Symbiodinium sp. KB8]